MVLSVRKMCTELDLNFNHHSCALPPSCDGNLDLSSGDVTSEQGAVLGSLLSTSTDVTQLCLNDCLLSEESVKVGHQTRQPGSG